MRYSFLGDKVAGSQCRVMFEETLFHLDCGEKLIVLEVAVVTFGV